MSGVDEATAVDLVFASLAIGAASGYVAGFVDGWMGHRFLGYARRLYRRLVSSEHPLTAVRLTRAAHVVRLSRRHIEALRMAKLLVLAAHMPDGATLADIDRNLRLLNRIAPTEAR